MNRLTITKPENQVLLDPGGFCLAHTMFAFVIFVLLAGSVLSTSAVPTKLYSLAVNSCHSHKVTCLDLRHLLQSSKQMNDYSGSMS